MARNRVIMEVMDINGRCPVYKKGDKIVIDPVPNEKVSVIDLEETNAICTRILGGSLISFAPWMEYVKPSPNGTLAPDFYKCPMVGPPYTKCGYVVFKLYGRPQTDR